MQYIVPRTHEELIHLSYPSREFARIGGVDGRYSAEDLAFKMLHVVIVGMREKC